MANEQVETVEEISIGELDSKDFKEARKNGVETVPKPEPKVEEHEEKEEKPKIKGGKQARIDRLTKQNAELRSQLEARAAKSEEKTAELSPESRTEPQVQLGRPKEADFASKEEYFDAFYDWKRGQERLAEAQAAAAAHEKQVAKDWMEKVSEARSMYEDFDAVLKQDIPIHPKIEDALRDMDNGLQVAYFLANNLEITKEWMQMSPSKALAEAWKLSEKLAKSETEEEEEETEENYEKPAVKEEKPSRKAPEPIKPVGNGRTRSSVPLHEVQDMKEFKRRRAAGQIQ